MNKRERFLATAKAQPVNRAFLLAPLDVSLENYRYYSHLLRQVVEKPERYLWEARKRGFWEEKAI